MHELTLCRQVIEIIEREANLRNIRYVHKIYLEMGTLVAVEKSAFLFCFDVVAKNTIAEKAILEIIEIAARAHCHACNKMIELSQRYSPCQFCGGFNFTIVAGEELKIKAMETEPCVESVGAVNQK